MLFKKSKKCQKIENISNRLQDFGTHETLALLSKPRKATDLQLPDKHNVFLLWSVHVALYYLLTVSRLKLF